jgi:hypothetical protein
VAVLAVCALLVGCTDRPVPVKPLVLCDSQPVEPEPPKPALTDAQRLAIDVAIIQAVGPDLGTAIIRWTDVEHPAWGRRQAARVAADVERCAG